MATLEARLSALVAALGTDFKLGTIPLTFSKQGALVTTIGTSKLVCFGSGLIIGVTAYIDVAPTGTTTFKLDVNKNDTSIYGTQANRPTWTSGSKTPTIGSHSVTTYSNGDFFSCDIDAIGSTVAGSHLTATVWLLRTGN